MFTIDFDFNEIGLVPDRSKFQSMGGRVGKYAG